jgi:NitT/TauT family transport system substrate-binding protein
MNQARPLLRMNQGDRSEGRIYYCPHFVAAEAGFFATEGIDVAFDWATSGGTSILGGQLPAVIDGRADLAIGGPMVVMRLAQDGGPPLAAFCAAVAANPWVLAAPAPMPGFSLARLAGCRVRDMAAIGTATLTFRWLLARHGVGGVTLEPSSGDATADIAALARGDVDYGLHSLHALGPAVAEGQVAVVADLARLTGPVPWSAYIARRDRMAAQPARFAAFTRAIGRALHWIASHDAAEIAALVARHYPGYPAAGLRVALAGYKASGTFASGPMIPRADHDRFARIMAETGWLTAPVSYKCVVEPGFAAGVIGGSP